VEKYGDSGISAAVCPEKTKRKEKREKEGVKRGGKEGKREKNEKIFRT